MTMTMRLAIITLAFFLLAALAPGADADPPVRDTVEAAIRHAGLAGDPTRSMRRRARWAGLAPWLTVRAARDLDWTDNDDTGEVDHGQAIELRATWRLDRLVFDGAEPRIASLARSRAKTRRELSREVIRLYFQRQRILADPEANPIDLAEVTAELDELTGGWFTKPRTGRP